MIINHLKSKVKIHDCALCTNCPGRLYSKFNDVVTYGFGNLNANKLIVLPSYSLDYKKDGSYISAAHVLIDKIGDSIFEDYYVTRETKCYTIKQYDITYNCRDFCSIILTKELLRIKAKHLFAFGDVDFHSLDPRVLNKFIIHRYFNPYCLIVGDEYVKKQFVEQLKEMESI